MVSAFRIETNAGGTGGKCRIPGHLYLYLDNCSALSVMPGQILGCLQQNRGEQVFCRENAEALKKMSHYTLVDSVLYALFLAVFCILGWYSFGIGYLFGIVLILFICITLTVLCAALSHLVYNASQMQEDQDLTI